MNRKIDMEIQNWGYSRLQDDYLRIYELYVCVEYIHSHTHTHTYIYIHTYILFPVSKVVIIRYRLTFRPTKSCKVGRSYPGFLQGLPDGSLTCLTGLEGDRSWTKKIVPVLLGN